MAKLLQVIVLLSMAGVIVGFFGRWHFRADLACHFRVQATAALLIAGLILWPLKRRRWSMASLLFGGMLAGSLVPFLWPNSIVGPGSYRLLTLNVLTSNPHPDRVIEYIVEQDPDFILLQETNLEWVKTLDKALAESWPYSKTVPRSDNFGIVIYSKIAWSSCNVVEYAAEIPTPSLSALIELPNGQPLRLIATHSLPPMSLPYWQARNSLFAELASDVQSVAADRTIVAGDLNCTPWSYWFRKLLRESGLHNSALGQGLGISWLPIPMTACGLPIDHVLVGSGIRVSHRQVGPSVGSDHRPIIVDFD